jgi:ABC-type glycerol-3-phosphate transport system permease component
MTATTKPVRAHTAVRARRRRNAGHVAGRAGFYLLVAAFVVASLFPFYWILVTSLKTPDEISAGTTGLWPSRLSIASYVADLHSNFLQSLGNSAIVAVSTTALTVVLASLAGYALARLGVRGRGGILGFVLLAGFFPVIAMVGPLFLVYRDIGLLDTYLALIVTYLVYTLPLATWFLTNYFAQLPAELEEAALVDGTSRLGALWRITVPLAVPGVFTTAILAFILAWNDFAFALSFLQSPGRFTAPLAIVNLGQSQYQVFYNRIDAAVVVVTIPIAVLVMLAQRRIISGLTAGSFR